MKTNIEIQSKPLEFAIDLINVAPVLNADAVNSNPLKLTQGRDILIINPFCSGGGDAALANKIANILVSQNCRVAIFPISVNEEKVLPHSSFSLSELAPDIHHFQNPLLIISPVQILKPEDASVHVQNIFEAHKWEKSDLILIEEMDLLPFGNNHREVEGRVSEFNALGFQSVKTHRLGFSEGSIGYLPVDEKSINEIKNRFEVELTNLFDSYHFSLNLNSNYYMAYISSDLPVTNSQVFLANTLVADHQEHKNANYIIVIRKFNPYYQKNLPKFTADFLRRNEPTHQYISLFDKANIYIANTEGVNCIQQITGSGTKKINIVFTSSLPQNIFHNFICLSRMGMASGDQSLCEFLSIKGQMPYYDTQPWKAPLSNALKMHAEAVGGENFKNEMSYRISELRPSTGKKVYKLRPYPAVENVEVLSESLQKFNELIVSKRADSIIKNLVAQALNHANT